MAGGPIEAKAAAAPAATLVAGYLSAVLISAVPWLHDHLTPDQQQSLPIIIAFLLSAAAAYFAPHTHRPDLDPAQTVVAELVEHTFEPAAAEAGEPPPARHTRGRRTDG